MVINYSHGPCHTKDDCGLLQRSPPLRPVIKLAVINGNELCPRCNFAESNYLTDLSVVRKRHAVLAPDPPPVSYDGCAIVHSGLDS